MDRAQRIITQAAHDAAGYLPGAGDSANGARLNYRLGLLHGEIRKLCGELAAFGAPECPADGYTVLELEVQGYTVHALVDAEGAVEAAYANGLDLLPLLDEVGLQSAVSERLEQMRRESREQAIADEIELERRYA